MKWQVGVAAILVVVLASSQADYGKYFKVEPSNPCDEEGKNMFCPPKWCPEDPSTLDCLDASCSDVEGCFDEISLSTHFRCEC